MLKRLTFVLALALAGVNSLSAATYYVSKSGNNANAGSQSAPWQTISKAASVAGAGDTVNIGAGTYSETVTFSGSGAGGSPILFNGAGPGATVIVGNVLFNGNYTTLANATVSPPGAVTGNVCGVLMGGTGDIFQNCIFENFGAPASQQASMVVFTGSYDAVKGCTFRNMADIDVFHVWGHDNLIQGNTVTNILQANYNLNHTDFIQTWLYTCYNITVDGNLVINSTCQLGNTETDGGNLYNWTICNNLFVNISNPFFSGIPQTLFLNNVFYNCAVPAGNCAISMYDSSTSGAQRSSSGDQVINNAFIGCGATGTIGSHGADLNAMTVQNNYYSDANFNALSSSGGGYFGTGALNGGNPGFVSVPAFNFHLLTNSILVGRGVRLSQYFVDDFSGGVRPAAGGWDIGPYMAGAGSVINTNVSYQAPAVSSISQNATDLDPTSPGIHIYEGTVVTYTGSASSPVGKSLTWQWMYSVNGGSSVVFQGGSGTVLPITFSYGSGTAGSTYVWTLQVSDGQTTVQSPQMTMVVEAPPVVGQGLSFSATSGTITAPFAINGSSISQTMQTTTVANGGRAAYTFTITNAGSYVVQALVNAPGDSANSFFVNMDSEPVDPTMIWDVTISVGFEQRLISWRGNGTDTSNQFVPQVFNLSAGNHTLIVRGREAGPQLQSFSLLKVPQPPQGLRVVAAGP